MWLKLVILGVVQGFTEFLPVSSDGHLSLARALLGLKEAGLEVDVLLHLGTLGALLVVYARDLAGLVRSLVRLVTGRAEPAERTFLICLVIGMIPVGIAGVASKDWIESLSNQPRLAAGLLYVTAAFLFASHRWRHATPRGR